jgi:hypothetical protein
MTEASRMKVARFMGSVHVFLASSSVHVQKIGQVGVETENRHPQSVMEFSTGE